METLYHSEELRMSEIMLKVQRAEVFPLKIVVGKGTAKILSKEQATFFSLGILMALEAKEQEQKWVTNENG